MLELMTSRKGHENKVVSTCLVVFILNCGWDLTAIALIFII